MPSPLSASVHLHLIVLRLLLQTDRGEATITLHGRVQKADVLPPPSPIPPQCSRDHSPRGHQLCDQETNPRALVPSGTLTSITNLATSLARNMDRLSLDEEHYNRQEEWRRQLPESLGEGLRQGLSRLGISLLGKGSPGTGAQDFPRAGCGLSIFLQRC